ncbi:hypothetical protein AWR38_01225 [Idiomarina sp. WRN-38]|nr:hypothetical protein AUR68_01220 [Idiomarina sp. H105]OAE96046.1 hypothetical protein AWR38_01225 [Idiomarina sp. WRN-38]
MSELIKVETSELEGAALDWTVAKAAGENRVQVDALAIPIMLREGVFHPCQFSRNWEQGGPLVEEHVTALNQSDSGGWWAHSGNHVGEALTPLIAAMRAIVASKLGDTVEVPKELVT